MNPRLSQIRKVAASLNFTTGQLSDALEEAIKRKKFVGLVKFGFTVESVEELKKAFYEKYKLLTKIKM